MKSILLIATLALSVTVCTPGATQDESASTLSALDAGIAEMQAAIAAHQDESCAGVGKLLELMVDVDQFVQFSLPTICPALDANCLRPVAERISSVESANLKLLKPIIEGHSWLELRTCGGKDAQFHAWILVQHSDQDKPFQLEVLKKMRAAFLAGEVSGTDYAYLVDRIASGAKRPQTFGTQGTCDGNGWKPDPVAAPEGLDARRHEVGLEPEREYSRTASRWCGAAPAP